VFATLKAGDQICRTFALLENKGEEIQKARWSWPRTKASRQSGILKLSSRCCDYKMTKLKRRILCSAPAFV
jgi:hypothetical protein